MWNHRFHSPLLLKINLNLILISYFILKSSGPNLWLHCGGVRLSFNDNRERPDFFFFFFFFRFNGYRKKTWQSRKHKTLFWRAENLRHFTMSDVLAPLRVKPERVQDEDWSSKRWIPDEKDGEFFGRWGGRMCVAFPAKKEDFCCNVQDNTALGQNHTHFAHAPLHPTHILVFSLSFSSLSYPLSCECFTHLHVV